jgi:hypothetical protein
MRGFADPPAVQREIRRRASREADGNSWTASRRSNHLGSSVVCVWMSHRVACEGARTLRHAESRKSRRLLTGAEALHVPVALALPCYTVSLKLPEYPLIVSWVSCRLALAKAFRSAEVGRRGRSKVRPGSKPNAGNTRAVYRRRRSANRCAAVLRVDGDGGCSESVVAVWWGQSLHCALGPMHKLPA